MEFLELKHIIAGSAGHDVRAAAASQRIGAQSSIQSVIAAAAHQGIVPVHALEDIAGQPIVVAGKDVAVIGADQILDADESVASGIAACQRIDPASQTGAYAFA